MLGEVLRPSAGEPLTLKYPPKPADGVAYVNKLVSGKKMRRENISTPLADETRTSHRSGSRPPMMYCSVN